MAPSAVLCVEAMCCLLPISSPAVGSCLQLTLRHSSLQSAALGGRHRVRPGHSLGAQCRVLHRKGKGAGQWVARQGAGRSAAGRKGRSRAGLCVWCRKVTGQLCSPHSMVEALVCSAGRLGWAAQRLRPQEPSPLPEVTEGPRLFLWVMSPSF